MDDVFVMLPYIAINSIITDAYHQQRDDKNRPSYMAVFIGLVPDRWIKSAGDLITLNRTGCSSLR